MTAISVTAFGGIAPKYPATMLEVKNAQTAINCDPFVSLRSLDGMLNTGVAVTAGPNSTIYRFGSDLISDSQYWFHWNNKTVDVVRSAISDDQTERTLFVLDGVARVTDNTYALTGGSGAYPWRSLKLGVPVPATQLTTTVGGVGTGAPETRYYVYTHVTGWGEESAPSDPVGPVTVEFGQTVTLGNFEPFVNGTNHNVTARRIYRTATGSAATDFQFVGEIPLADTSFIDSIETSALGEVCPSFEWEMPPTMDGIIGVANGINVGFKGVDVFISEAYRPFAWPSGYRLSTNFDIVGGASFGNYAVLCTKGNPYLLHGTSPSSMSLTKIEIPQACVSRRSIVEIGSGVIYASPDGLVYVSATEPAQVITEKHIDQKFWRTLAPTSISGYMSENRYIGFFNNGTVQGGFMYNLMTGDFVMLDFYADAGFRDLQQDALYLKVGTSIFRFERGPTPYTYTWRSKRFNLPKPTNFSAVQVVAKTYPVTFRYYSEEVLKHTQTVTSATPFRLPSGFLSERVEFELTGTAEVYAVHIATGLDEIKAL
jgi:hypothetical protein